MMVVGSRCASSTASVFAVSVRNHVVFRLVPRGGGSADRRKIGCRRVHAAPETTLQTNVYVILNIILPLRWPSNFGSLLFLFRQRSNLYIFFPFQYLETCLPPTLFATPGEDLWVGPFPSSSIT